MENGTKNPTKAAAYLLGKRADVRPRANALFSQIC